jgi:mitochondrial FAD-linked sulfhydryl oxidase
MGKANDHVVFKNDHPADCDRPACDDMMSKLKKAAQAAAAATAAPPTPTANTKSTPVVVDSPGGPLGSADLGRSTWGLLHSMVREWYLSTKSLAEAYKATRKLMLVVFHCLLNKAAWYPEQPTVDDKKSMVRFFSALARFYPCPWYVHTCAVIYVWSSSTHDAVLVISLCLPPHLLGPRGWLCCCCTRCAHDFRDNLKTVPVQADTRQDLCQWLCRQHNLVNTKLGKPIFACDMPSLDRRWRQQNNNDDDETTEDAGSSNTSSSSSSTRDSDHH